MNTPARAFRHWLPTLNIGLAVLLGGGLAAPVLAAMGWRSFADGLYTVYHLICHQWAFRTFFLFTPGAGPLTIYSQQQLADGGTDPYSFIGSPALGWKMAFCERDLAIYLGLLAVGLLYAQRRAMRPASFAAYGVLVVPMALDGFTQLFGWRESTWELRVSTGLVFGVASAWLVLPRLDEAFGLRPLPGQYSPGEECRPPVQALATAALTPASAPAPTLSPAPGQAPTLPSAQAPAAELRPLAAQEPAPVPAPAQARAPADLPRRG
jgi:uncharacterized membrane protein